MPASYTPQELSTIAEAPMLVGMAIAAVDMGIVSTAIEAAAMSREITGAAKRYPNNSIIQSTFAEEVLRSGVVKLEKPSLKAEDVQSGALVDQALAAVDAALTTIGTRATPEEILEYKQFIYACADAVANAAGSGLFGSGSPKISDKEAAALTKVKAALGI
jgi:hypothetical protein